MKMSAVQGLDLLPRKHAIPVRHGAWLSGEERTGAQVAGQYMFQ